MSNNPIIYRVNLFDDCIQTFDLLYQLLDKEELQHTNIKWVFILFHNFLQCLFILAVKDTNLSNVYENNLSVYSKRIKIKFIELTLKIFKRNLSSYQYVTLKSQNAKLKSFEGLFKMLKNKNKNLNFAEFGTTVSFLNKIRSEFIHLKVSSYSLEYNFIKNVILKAVELAILILNNTTIVEFVAEPEKLKDLRNKLNNIYMQLAKIKI